jgi:4-alpha-glucanotransferase
MKTDRQWEKIGKKPHHGIALPISSIRSNNSSGIGEFLDLIPLIHFCKQIHFDTIQLLPLNDTGTDTSPYNAVSSCALDPIYLSLKYLQIDNTSFQEFNEAPRVCLHEVKQKKLSLLYPYFQKHFSNIAKSKEYLEFIEEEKEWLIPYAQFKALSNEYQNVHWQDFPKIKHEPKDVEFYLCLQFLCFEQMKMVHTHATKQGCFIKGDLPILIGSNSADVWMSPHLFIQDLVAGAPPDYYNRMGQKWPFPILDREALRRDHFSWWKRRLKVASKLYHIYRIDHVVGLFRIWAIEQNKDARDGHFIPEDSSLWEFFGREMLEMMIESSRMLPIAEDLGTIPPIVPQILQELGVCGTKVIRWERRWNDGKEFIPLNEYPPFSLTTVSTHDSDTLTLWWKNSPEEARVLANSKQWTYDPILSQKQRLELLFDAHHSSSFFHVNLLQEYLALFPELIAENPEDERINTPGVVLPTNWTYRFKPTIEEMLQNKQLIGKLKQLTVLAQEM